MELFFKIFSVMHLFFYFFFTKIFLLLFVFTSDTEKNSFL